MKTRRKTIVAALALLVAGSVIFGLPVVAGGDEASYWNRFKTLFVDWDDNAQPGTAKTETVGVRGLDLQKEIGAKGYDWPAVKYMEDFKVSLADQKQFLKEGKLGPYQ